MAEQKSLYVYHHVFLPPQLPQSDDFSPRNESALLEVVQDSVVEFRKYVPESQASSVEIAIGLMQAMVRLHQTLEDTVAVDESELLKILENPVNKGLQMPLNRPIGGVVSFNIRAQNAGVLITRDHEAINVEAFELSPTNESVMATKGRLRRSFPGVGISIPLKRFVEPGFQEVLAATLAKMSSQAIAGTQPRAKKAGRFLDESRDTASPEMITEFIYSYLLANGEALATTRILKNTREEVNWSSALLPWHRSSTWLLIRVSLQLLFTRMVAETASHRGLYKTFMVFVMARVLDHALNIGLPSDILLSMVSKLSKRILKLQSKPAPAAIDFVKGKMCLANKFISDRWTLTQQQNSPTLGPKLDLLRMLDFNQDSIIRLEELDSFLRTLRNRKNSATYHEFTPSWLLVSYRPSELQREIRTPDTEHLHLHLICFEGWVEAHLQSWLQKQLTIGSHSTCSTLRHAMESYHSTASSFYAENPETTSIMLLTILELWVACDKAAVHFCPLLAAFDHEIPRGPFQNLLLPTHDQMDRLRNAELYLKRRRRNSSGPPIYHECRSSACFAVRFFDDSDLHQQLKRSIEEKATRDREAKKKELQKLKSQYESLMQRHRNSSCEYYQKLSCRNYTYVDVHSRSCSRCSYKQQADRLRIDVHEWPLPRHISAAKSTVFELSVPESFGYWREASMFVLFKVLKVHAKTSEQPRADFHLRKYQALLRFYSQNIDSQHIGLLSQDKPHMSTHRRKVSVGTATEASILLDNALNFAYFDDRRGCFISSFESSDVVSQQCTYRLPKLSKPLQQFLFRPSSSPSGPTPNTVVATLQNCPEGMTLEEYKDLASIPIGHNLQWMNILRQLFASTVDFKKRETGLIIQQCIYQAGPEGDNALRSSHAICGNDSFPIMMLEGVSEAMQRFKENWQSSTALSSFTAISRRMISLSQCTAIQQKGLACLTEARDTTFAWAKNLKTMSQNVPDDKERLKLQRRSLEVALICADSFNVDEKFQRAIFSTTESASVYFQCCFAIQEGSQTLLDSSDELVRYLYYRWQRTSYLHWGYLAKMILVHNSFALDDAISATWSAYEPSHKWTTLSETHSCWLASTTTSQSGQMAISYNLITGELLVNGVPLDHLPGRYLSHLSYQGLFGKMSLEIMPTSIQGMQYSAKRQYAGHVIHLGTSQDLGHGELDVLVQAYHNQNRYDLIPRRLLTGKFPTKFVNDYVHWYDYNRNCVEFCDKQVPWKHDRSHWRLIPAPWNRWTLVRDGTALIDVNSRSAKAISSILRPLEDQYSIHIIHNETDGSLFVDLAKARLEFTYQSKETSLMSRQYRGMSVDANQSIGTLVGLKDKLILRIDQPCHAAITPGRKVLILEGCVSHMKHGEHVKVCIEKGRAAGVHQYDVDARLGRLVLNGNLQSKLFLCYLHALTSFGIPDPLTGKTGTEEALSILDSASVRSFDVLTRENVALLGLLAELTPSRAYYPTNERVMQTVGWSPQLSFLSQHGLFHDSVQSILQQAEKLRFFHPQLYFRPPPLDHANHFLLDRDNLRSSTFRVSGFGAERQCQEHDDTHYAARDRRSSDRRTWAFMVANLLSRRTPCLVDFLPHGLKGCLWNFLRSHSSVLGSAQALSIKEIAYNPELLSKTSQFITRNFLTMQRSLRGDVNKYRLMIWLAMVAYFNRADITIIQTLASFHSTSKLSEMVSPAADQFDLSEGKSFVASKIRSCLTSNLVPLSQCPEARMTQNESGLESSWEFRRRQEEQYDRKTMESVTVLTKILEAQWPCSVPVIPRHHPDRTSWNTYVRMDAALPAITALFKSWHDNLQFYAHLGAIASHLPTEVNTVPPMESRLSTPDLPSAISSQKQRYLGEDDFFRETIPHFVSESVSVLDYDSICQRPKNAGGSVKNFKLPNLLSRLGNRQLGQYERQHVNGLKTSLEALQHHESTEVFLKPCYDEATLALLDYLQNCKKTVQKLHSLIMMALFGQNGGNCVANIHDIYQRPRFSPFLLLRRLNHLHRDLTPIIWRKYLVQYGIAVTQLQRAERMLASSGDAIALTNELRNSGHRNWSPNDHPDTLLLEIESGMMVRDVQERIAGQMRDPPAEQSAVMQLNMGEGKSSVILPMVAAATANGSQMVRAIVAKAQSKQMEQMLDATLGGGLIQRPVFRMPFSRALQIGLSEAETIHTLFKECMESKGVLLIQPEHILSFKLMGFETAIADKAKISQSLIRSQQFLDEFSRNIVDESDENFNVKFELVYTMGSQQPVEHSPDRWVCIHEVLGVMRRFLPAAQEADSTSIEVSSRHKGCFPRTRILRESAKDHLLSLIARHISEAGLAGLPIGTPQARSLQQAVYTYITKFNLTPAEASEVESSTIWSPATKNTLLLLRGLIACQIFSFVFCQKRWRVDYGLDYTREPGTRLAVPYKAKDNPSARSEFSHPDVIITLTSLSYYYGGLKDAQIHQTFEHLLHSDQADMEYCVWVEDSDQLPTSFHQLSGINLDDGQCVRQIFPCIRYAKGTIDYFLQHIVFPKEVRAFPYKLSASGWDIGKETANPTTGFSGTNDSCAFLPLSVRQLDLPDQKHTNALVLEYLLQDENSVALMPSTKEASKTDAETLLEMVVKLDPPARVILDVGAQILELDNVGVAERWLEMTVDNDKTQAVIFCDEDDHIRVVDRKGRIESFQTSPFATQTDVCLVFLDEAHTRGTDLKLPESYRAAVTLGANLTKDRLVQACMRMRKLGKGQSVVFCVPDEINQKISSAFDLRDNDLAVDHILEWSIMDTFKDLRRGIWLWANQGRRYQNQKLLWEEVMTDDSPIISKVHAERFLEEEAQTLETRYKPTFQLASEGTHANDQGSVDAITERLLQLGGVNPESTTFREEQERELSPEVEQEREVQRPPAAKPARHAIHPDVRAFISDGVVERGSEAFLPAFKSFGETSAAKQYDVSRIPRGLLVTEDFARTIVPLGNGYNSDLFQRSVQWILTSASKTGKVTVAAIISPHEAQELLPEIERSSFVSIHIYAPRPNLGFRPLDGLDLYVTPGRSVPRTMCQRLVTELNLFSGQLYIKSIDDYLDLRRFLTLDSEGTQIGATADFGVDSDEIMNRGSLIQFFKTILMKIRRNCESIDKTHVGKILNQRALDASDLEKER
ncbi:hypothetical protein BDP81DRAFT_515603 [Colletotrichum phormii]|uniref:ubiquitinyl hydrolase 1 n=1 Tax=Colletotrichum phormii TaxID=359342 RepID=A0AAI9ZUE5_9PEZI|nr:uncharacterized protein BDP81DRAFT_515603 [Colletotrichum phormii]KAK1638040.1 hypothetical protein BDP81DRAFT_515603 [Colletotrichum phormii]